MKRVGALDQVIADPRRQSCQLSALAGFSLQAWITVIERLSCPLGHALRPARQAGMPVLIRHQFRLPYPDPRICMICVFHHLRKILLGIPPESIPNCWLKAIIFDSFWLSDLFVIKRRFANKSGAAIRKMLAGLKTARARCQTF